MKNLFLFGFIYEKNYIKWCDGPQYMWTRVLQKPITIQGAQGMEKTTATRAFGHPNEFVIYATTKWTYVPWKEGNL